MIKDGHLGGFVLGGDQRTYYPELWDSLITDYKLDSVVDVGCGEGHAAKYFFDKGLNVMAIDGSELVKQSAVFEDIYIHDYTKAPLVLDHDFDLVWCCEFVEHIEEQYLPNFLETFKSGKIIAMTHALPGQGGYHHVNEAVDIYWLNKLAHIGYTCDWEATQKYRAMAHDYFQISGLIFKRISA